MTHEELLARARKHMWAAWALSSEELASQAAETLIGLGMLVPEGGAAELVRLRARVAELEAAPSVAYLAMDGVRLLGLYHEESDALRHCEEAAERSNYRTCPVSWRRAPGGTSELFAWTYREIEGSTGLSVSPIEVRPEFDEGWGQGADETVKVSADRLTALFAPTQALREDPHDSPLHHTYLVGRDLPEPGGA